METPLRNLAQAEPLLDKVQIKPQVVSSDQARALAVAYLEARDVAQRLDDVCGPESWSDSYHALQSGPDWVVECRLNINGVTKCDVGVGDDAKAAYSDALKRAAVKFGLGRFLYNLPKIWGDYDAGKQRFVEPLAVRAQMLNPIRLSPVPEPTQDTDAAASALSDKQMTWLLQDLLRRPGIEAVLQENCEKVDTLSRAKRALGYLLAVPQGDMSARFARVATLEEWKKLIDVAKRLPVALPTASGQ